jgi:hypothetical protein
MNGCGAQATMATSVAAAVAQAHQRQRGEGSDPVGVSSRMNPRQATMGMPPCCSYTATQSAAGSEPGRASSP